MSSNFFLSRSEILPLIAVWREQGFEIIFTSGTFDLLHRGHVIYLNQAKNYLKQPSKLVVGVNSDISVKRYKGSGRPICSERDRLEVVSSLRSVDLGSTKFVLG